jgi:hypothetical protein
MSARAIVRQGDLERSLRAARNTGFTPRIVHRGGEVVVLCEPLTDEPAEEPMAADPANPWDEVLTGAP